MNNPKAKPNLAAYVLLAALASAACLAVAVPFMYWWSVVR